MCIMSYSSIIQSTKELRRKPRHLKCGKGNEAAHLVGLNLLKELFNFYSEKKHINLNSDELMQVIQDANDDMINLQCETHKMNAVYDKMIENEVLHYIFGEKTIDNVVVIYGYDDISSDAQLLFNRLKSLLSIIIYHLKQRDKDSNDIDQILNDLNTKPLPLSHYCFQCDKPSIIGEITGIKVFCNESCQELYYK